MKLSIALVVAAGTASVLSAAPQESVTFTNVESRNLIGSATNVTLNHTFSGAYTVRKLNITGTVTDPGATVTWSRESSILVTPPGGGTPFIIQPYGGTDTQVGQPVAAGAFSIPVTPVAAAGNWSFEFFELWDDTADDAPNAVWTSIGITLDDAAPANPAPFNPAVNKVYTDVPVVPTVFTDTWAVPAATGAADTIAVRGLGVATGANASANINASPLWRVRVRVTAPGRAAVTLSPFRNTPAGIVSTSAATGEAFAAIPGGLMNDPQGNWLVEIFDELGTSSSHLRNLSVSLGRSTPPASSAFPTLSAGNWVSATGTFAAAGEVKWYSMVVPAEISAGANTALDIDMIGTALAAENDASFALYSATGALQGGSFNSGPGLLPQISFGKGTRPGAGADGIPYDGANPAVSPNGNTTTNVRPVLPAATYYLAVANGDTTTAYGAALFNVTPSTEANTGPFTVRARYLNPVSPVVPASTDLGTLGGSQNLTSVIDLNNSFVWYKVTLASDANDTTGKYLDIDTANTGAPMNDTNLALYDSDGNLKSLNDDIAPGWGAANPTGGNSALSFGSGTTPRDYTAVNANLPQGDGRDGTLTAGTYYLQVSMCCAGYGDNNFWVINDYVTNLDLGNINLNINTNYPPVGSACGPADIGTTGGTPGFDNLLNNNDFIVFIDRFFASAPSADIGTTGGTPGSDGLWNNNDFIVFIDQFFAGPASCR